MNYTILGIGETISDAIVAKITEIRDMASEKVNDFIIRSRAVGSGRVKDFTAAEEQREPIKDKKGKIVGRESFAFRAYHYGVDKILWVESFVLPEYNLETLHRGLQAYAEHRGLSESVLAHDVAEKLTSAWHIEQLAPYRAKDIKPANLAKDTTSFVMDCVKKGMSKEEIGAAVVDFLAEKQAV